MQELIQSFAVLDLEIMKNQGRSKAGYNVEISADKKAILIDTTTIIITSITKQQIIIIT